MPRRTYQGPRLCGEPLLSHASIWGAPKPAGSFGSVLVGPLLLSSQARGMENLVCALQVWNLFPSVCWKAYNQVPLAITTRFPGDSQSLCWIPRLEGLTWGSEPSQKYENFFGIIVLQSVGHSPGGYGMWFSCDCTPPPILLWLLLCLWTCSIFFLVGSNVLLSKIFQHLAEGFVPLLEEGAHILLLSNPEPEALLEWN